MTREESNRKQRGYRKRNGNLCNKRYEKSKKGFLMRVYRNMKSRIIGIQKAKHHLYKGKFLLPKEDFYSWSEANEDFHRLFKEWETSEYDRKLTPSVDRVNSEEGYSLSNMEWVTHSVNSRRGSLSNARK